MNCNLAKHRILLIGSAIGVMTLLYACSSSSKPDDAKTSEDVLIEFDDQVLTVTEVESRMPAGLEAADSVDMFNAIVDSWLTDRLLEDAALTNIGDDARINKLVEQYRRSLLVEEYRRRMKVSAQGAKMKEDSLLSYYNRHEEDYKLERPLVKGVFIKIPDSSERLNDVKKWMSDASQKSIDRLEKHALGDALQYEYFADDWQDWEALSNQIPYHFPDADTFVKNTHYFETAYGSNVYILHITDYLPSGAKMPYEIAVTQIRAALADAARENSEKKLMHTLKSKVQKQGRLKFYPSYKNK